MNIISRSAWGARHANGFRDAPLPATEVFLHHSVTTAPDLVPPFDDDHKAIRRLEDIGQARFGGGISYTWLITPVGLIFEGHGVNRQGAHTKGHNTRGRAICLVGDYQSADPTPAQVDASVWLLCHAKGQGWLREVRITGGHRDVKATACPGDRAYRLIGEINRRAAATGAVDPHAVDIAATVPVGSTVVFIGGYDSGDFSQWSNLQNKVHNGPAAGYDQSHYSMRVENAGPGHETAARIEVRSGDVPDFGGGERAEVRARSVAKVHEGDERWYEFSVKFDKNFPSPNGGWCIVMQWHAGSGSPPLCLEVHSDDKLYVQSNARGSRWSIPIGDIARGQWVDYVLHAKFSQDSSVGFVEMWRNGTVVVPRTPKRTMTSDESYLKQGLYRDADETTMILWHDGLRITAP